MPKIFKPRSPVSVLIEESARGSHDGVLHKMLNAEALPNRLANTSTRTPKHTNFCPVTGLEEIYTDPKTGIPYANLKALQQIRERQPPWILQGNHGTAAYFEAVKSLRNDE